MIRMKKEAKNVDFRKYKNMSTSQIAQTLMGHVLSDIEEDKVNECKKIGESVNKRMKVESSKPSLSALNDAKKALECLADNNLVTDFNGNDAIRLINAMEYIIRNDSEAIWGYDI